MNKFLRIIALSSTLVSFLLSTHASGDQLDPRLDDLFQQLQATNDATEAVELEGSIWQIWVEHDDPEINRLMLEGSDQMNRGAFASSLATFDLLIELAPNYAEAWNKRATLHYLLKNYRASTDDISKTLELEPRHFGALSGLGSVYMAEEEYFLARRAFNDALKANPNMENIKVNLEALEQYFTNTAI